MAAAWKQLFNETFYFVKLTPNIIFSLLAIAGLFHIILPLTVEIRSRDLKCVRNSVCYYAQWTTYNFNKLGAFQKLYYFKYLFIISNWNLAPLLTPGWQFLTQSESLFLSPISETDQQTRFISEIWSLNGDAYFSEKQFICIVCKW